MAKASLNKIEQAGRQTLGRVVRRCFEIAGLSQKEAAARVNRDQAQVARWISGDERAQVDTLLAVDALRQPLLLALAELAGDGVAVQTTITVRRTV